MKPFDYINEILVGKKQLIIDESTEKDYQPFITNRSLSYHKDCIMQSNEINRRHFIDKKMQFDFLMTTIRSYKRPFTKWIKPEKNDDIQCVKIYFGYSDSKAVEALKILSKDQIKEIKIKTHTGGIKNTK